MKIGDRVYASYDSYRQLGTVIHVYKNQLGEELVHVGWDRKELNGLDGYTIEYSHQLVKVSEND